MSRIEDARKAKEKADKQYRDAVLEELRSLPHTLAPDFIELDENTTWGTEDETFTFDLSGSGWTAEWSPGEVWGDGETPPSALTSLRASVDEKLAEITAEIRELESVADDLRAFFAGFVNTLSFDDQIPEGWVLIYSSMDMTSSGVRMSRRIWEATTGTRKDQEKFSNERNWRTLVTL